MDEEKKRILVDIVNREFPELIRMLERTLDFARWGFKMIFSGVAQATPILVYSSDFCRIKFLWQTPDIRDQTATIQIYYGRLHAPIDEDIIVWNGQSCWCWHDIRNVICFLDQVPPHEVASDRLGQPKIMAQFRNSSVRSWTQPEFLAKMHAAIWETYGPRLFAVFDIRQPVLWEQFTNYMMEYEKIDPGFTATGFPPRDKVC